MAGIVALREWLRSKPGHGLREEREKPMPGLTPNWALFLASLCLVGVIVSVFNLCSHTTAPAPMFINPGPVQDVGTVRQNATVSAQFLLRNTSREDIILFEPSTTCSCTSATVSRSDLRPDDESIVTLTFDSGHTRGKTGGEALLSWRYADSTDVRTLRLALEATVDPDYEVQPLNLEFSSTGGRQSAQIEIWPTHVPSLKVLDVSSNSSFLATRVLEADPPGRTIIDVAFDPRSFYMGTGTPKVIVRTDCSSQPVVSIPVIVSRDGDVVK